MIRKLVLALIAVMFFASTLYGAFALEEQIDACLIQDRSRPIFLGFDNESVPEEVLTYVRSNCTETVVEWVEGVNVSILGDVQPGEVIIEETFVYVDTYLRPDLDRPAVIIFNNPPFAMEPDVYKDDVLCDTCVEVWDQDARVLEVSVDGFSNYSLTGQQDFTVYSDTEPELRNRVYQTIDLGDGNRSTEYKCVVQIYGRNGNGEYILVQTNPERNVAARLWGSPDANNPESLGYFPTENGIANVYFDGSKLSGYAEFEYVAQCASNETKYIYEETIDTRYIPAGRGLTGRAIWLADGGNAFYVSLMIFAGFFLIIFALLFLRMWWRILRGY